MRLERMTWVEAEEYFKTHDMALISTGSIECHGRHNPLGTDTLIPMRLVDLILERNPDILALPTLPFGDCDWHRDFPGAVSIGGDLLQEACIRICDCLYRWGVRRFVFLNGHGGNTRPLEKCCDYLDQKGAIGAIVNWWKVAGELNPAWKGGHGAGEETAAILSIDPTLVKTEEISDCEAKNPTENLIVSGLRTVTFKGATIMLPRPNRRLVGNGWYGPDHPSTATKEWGDEMLDATADYVVDFMEEFEKMPII